MVWYVGRGYVIQHHELMNEWINDKGGHRAARAAKNTDTISIQQNVKTIKREIWYVRTWNTNLQ